MKEPNNTKARRRVKAMDGTKITEADFQQIALVTADRIAEAGKKGPLDKSELIQLIFRALLDWKESKPKY